MKIYAMVCPAREKAYFQQKKEAKEGEKLYRVS